MNVRLNERTDRVGLTVTSSKDSQEEDGLFRIVVESGILKGSVRIVGTLPDPLCYDDAEKLIEALRVVKESSASGFSRQDVFLSLKGTRCRQ